MMMITVRAVHRVYTLFYTITVAFMMSLLVPFTSATEPPSHARPGDVDNVEFGERGED